MVVVFSIARYEVQRRYREINLLKVLGAGFSNIRSMILLEFGILSSMAAFFGVVLSMAMSYTLSWQIFESLWLAQQCDGYCRGDFSRNGGFLAGHFRSFETKTSGIAADDLINR